MVCEEKSKEPTPEMPRVRNSRLSEEKKGGKDPEKD